MFNTMFSALFSLDHTYIMQAKPVFIPTDNLRPLSALSTQRTELRTWEQMCHKHPFSWIPLSLFSKRHFALADRGTHAGGQWQMGSRRAAPAPSTPASPCAPRDTGTTALPRAHMSPVCRATCSCTLETWPGLTSHGQGSPLLSLCGNKVRWHPVPEGLSWAGRKVRSASGLHDVNAHMPSLLLCFLLLNSNCSHQPVSLKMYQIFQKYIWRLSSSFC